ncbi:MAG: S8 family serine peptidase, partial [Bacteroidota bacterium]
VALNSAIEIQSDVINLSWGILQTDPPEALECAISRAQDSGIIVVTSAGNENAPLDTAPQWPANFSHPAFKYDNMITVGAMTYPDFNPAEEPIKASFSSFSGNVVDLAAYLTWKTPKFNAVSDEEFTFIAGTSISAPIVTGSLSGQLGPNGGSLPNWFSSNTKSSTPLLISNQVRDGLFLPLCDDLQ